jgi:hypothetical protein
MAEHGSSYVPGEMDIHQNEASYAVFLNMAKWGSLAVAVTVLAATLWFCTPAGFLGGLIPAVVVLALGIFLMRAKPGAAH